MQNSIRSEFHTELSNTILTEIQYRRANYFYFLGKTDVWGESTDTPPTEIQEDSSYENQLIRTNALYIKRITPGDVSLVTNRYNWVSGSVYKKWDHTKDMSSEQFYVFTDENNVYKCLDNYGEILSTVKPTGKSLYPFRTSDGYLWKYMYNVPAFKRSRFSQLTYIPVQNALTDSFYNKGSIDAVYVENRGTGYVDAQLTTISVSGTTTGTGATGNIAVSGIGAITSINITNGGDDYTNGVNVSISSSTGTGAILEAVIVGGVVTDVNIIEPGYGYEISDTLVFSVGGATVFPIISRETGEFVEVLVTNPGAGYSGQVTLTITQSPASGTGLYGNPGAVLEGVVYNGSLQRVLITDPGQNYPTDNATTILVQGDGTDAVFSPVIDNGEIIAVVVENSGTGYTSAILTIVGAGTDAKLSAIVTAQDFTSDQQVIEQIADPGKIYAIEVSNPGDYYSQDTVVTITGDGTGCTANAIIENGGVKSVVVTNFGSGYTYANVSFFDPNRMYFLDDKTATAYAIFPPIGGHGKDAKTELFGQTLAINVSLRQDTTINPLEQDFRQYGILKNPTEIISGRLYNGTNSLIAYKLNFDSTVGLVDDEILIFNSVKYRVIDFADNIVTLQQIGISSIVPLGSFYAEDQPERTYTSNRVVLYPVVNKYTGKLLYASNETPFQFSPEQGISIKTFLKF